MKIKHNHYQTRDLKYTVRSATEEDAKALSQVRLQIDGETEYLDREKGEAYIDERGFKEIIKDDSERSNHLFQVAEVNGRIAGFSRCEGSGLKRISHHVEFGVGVLKEFWGYGIGKALLDESVKWADSNEIRKVTLKVIETNEKAIKLYEDYGFEVEGVLKEDKLLSDGNYYHTILMARFNKHY
ncbi:GNAT family N-acetyltransferase [Rossellomorea aquimaris]|nr:GNAT family N-acetyltransferase [Rossellomorea aquimaris]WRP07225.1 GNAT family N-acetyltransferase [Rossellomorea aquimaris]